MKHFTDTLIENIIQEASLNYSTELDKIREWHSTGRRNVKSMSDEKLKFDYAICKTNGYEYEASVLKSEGKSRGLSWAIKNDEDINKITLIDADFILADVEFINNNPDKQTLINKVNSTNTPIKNSIIFIIIALVLHKIDLATALKQNIIDNNNKIAESDIKTIVQNTATDAAIISKLTELINSLNESLQEEVEKHNTLNPKLWNEDNTLKPEVEEKINAIVDNFLKDLEDNEIKFKINDIKLVGSNVSYNWNPKSDLDIHIEMDTDSLHCPDNLYPLLYSAYRSIWNKNHDVDFYGIPVEIFVETSDTKQQNTEVLQEEILSFDDFKQKLEVTTKENPFILEDPVNSNKLYQWAYYIYKDHDNYIIEYGPSNGTNKKFDKKCKDVNELINYLQSEFSKFVENLEEARQQTALTSNGIYSVLNKKWIKEPVLADIPEVDQEAFDTLLAEWEVKYQEVKNNPTEENITKFIEDLYDIRRESINNRGEYDTGNLVFKEIRNKGYLDELKELRNGVVSKELSLESLKEDLIQYETIDDLEKVFNAYKSCEDKEQKRELYKAVNQALYQCSQYGPYKCNGDKGTPKEKARYLEIENFMKNNRLAEDFKIFDD